MTFCANRNRFPVVAKNQKGEDVTFDLYYRPPTTEEIISYNSRLFQKKNGKVINNVVPTRIELGLRILTGIQDGIFWVNGQAVSSDQSSPDYYPAWKDLAVLIFPETFDSCDF